MYLLDIIINLKIYTHILNIINKYILHHCFCFKTKKNRNARISGDILF